MPYATYIIYSPYAISMPLAAIDIAIIDDDTLILIRHYASAIFDIIFSWLLPLRH